MNQESKRPIAIEDLLRLKRAERPPAEFWSEFDRELRAKQLAALVEKRPWWRSVSLNFRGLARYHLPLGAAAVLAVTLITLREYHSTPNAVAGATSESAVANVAAPTQAALEIAAPGPVESAIPAVATSAPAPAPVATFSSEATVPGELARMVPLLPLTTHQEIRPSARSIAQNLAAAEAVLGTTTSGFETRAIPVSATPREPLAQMSNPAEERRNRFAMAFAAASTENGPSPSARVARRLSDEQLYDSIRRFGARGDRVSFRF